MAFSTLANSNNLPSPNKLRWEGELVYWQYFFTPPGGWGNRRSYDLARFWAQIGIPTWIIAGGTYFPPSYPKPRAFRSEGTIIIWQQSPYHQKYPLLSRVFHLLRFTLWSTYILWRLRRRKTYLIATVPPPFLPIVAALRKKITGKPFAVELYDGWPALLLGLPGKARLIGYLLMPIMRWAYREAHLRIALSPGIASLFPNLSFHLSYNGTRPELFRRRSMPPFLPFRVIYAGTLGWINHLHFLLQVAHLLQEWAGIEFWIIGDGKELSSLRQIAQSLKRVYFYEPIPVELLPYWLSQAHIGVSLTRPIPILATNSANKFYDYLANGLVVGINYGGWQAEVLEKEGCGFAAFTPEDFAQSILRYYWHRDEWMRAAARARLLAEKRYDRRHLAREWIERLYSRLSL